MRNTDCWGAFYSDVVVLKMYAPLNTSSLENEQTEKQELILII